MGHQAANVHYLCSPNSICLIITKSHTSMVDGQDYYDVYYYDTFLEIDDFSTIAAADADTARERFFDDHPETDRYEITSIEHAFTDPDLGSLPPTTEQ